LNIYEEKLYRTTNLIENLPLMKSNPPNYQEGLAQPEKGNL